MRSGFLTLLLAPVLLSLLAGCSIQYKFTINEPLVSNIKYDIGQKKPVVMKIVDQRANKTFLVKLARLKDETIDLVNVDDPIAWLSQALEKEFAARDIPLKIANKNTTAPPDLVLTIKTYQLASRQVVLLSPWETYLSFMGDLVADGQTYSVRAYFYNGKVYGGTIKEIEEACYNIPLSIVVKEIASKINRYALHYFAGEETLKEFKIQAEKKIKAHDEDAYRPVLALGNSGNALAVKPLLTFSNVKDLFPRACALSGIGTLGAQYEFAFLKKKYEEYRELDKYMALKSIGDLGTPEAIDFIRQAREDPLYRNEYAFKYLVDLYLER